MKKDIEWFNNEVEKRINRIKTGEVSFLGGDLYGEGYIYGMREVQAIANQLDEPEVLSQELPVIPKFVADYLDFAKSDVPLMRVLEIANTRSELPKWEKEYDWISANDEKFARAWLDGYTVGEEPKYYLIFPSFDELGQGFNYLAKDMFHRKLWIEDSRTDGLDWEERSSFTENEIRDMEKGDILFEHFAVKVEELEE